MSVTQNFDGRTLQLHAACCTETGPVRLENQDAVSMNGIVGLRSGFQHGQWFAMDKPFIAAIVDGMGGHEGGADAASIAACAVARMKYEDWNDVDGFLGRLSKRIGYAGGAWQTPDMGAALAMLAITPGRVIVANVGDCRIYRFDGRYLAPWSQDDRVSPASSALTQALGGNTTVIDSHMLALEEHESSGRFILCTDGVWETLGQERLEQICKTCDSPEQVIFAIRQNCFNLHASDNFSAICIDVPDCNTHRDDGYEH